MISQLVNRLKQEGRWDYFETFFKGEKDAVLKDLMAKAPNITSQDITEANTKIKMFDDLINLENWASNREREGVK